MFIGLIKGTGIVERVEPELIIKVDADLAANIELKSHLAVNGRVLRVLSKDIEGRVSRLKFYSSNLNQSRSYVPEEKVNLEPAVRLGEEIPGTFFYGIPTATVQLVSRELLSDGKLSLKVLFQSNLVNYLSAGDCVCLDGVFLQIIALDNELVSFNIYSSTLNTTNLSEKQSVFNFELDPFTLKIARVLERFSL